MFQDSKKLGMINKYVVLTAITKMTGPTKLQMKPRIGLIQQLKQRDIILKIGFSLKSKCEGVHIVIMHNYKRAPKNVAHNYRPKQSSCNSLQRRVYINPTRGLSTTLT